MPGAFKCHRRRPCWRCLGSRNAIATPLTAAAVSSSAVSRPRLARRQHNGAGSVPEARRHCRRNRRRTVPDHFRTPVSASPPRSIHQRQYLALVSRQAGMQVGNPPLWRSPKCRTVQRCSQQGKAEQAASDLPVACGFDDHLASTAQRCSWRANPGISRTAKTDLIYHQRGVKRSASPATGEQVAAPAEGAGAEGASRSHSEQGTA